MMMSSLTLWHWLGLALVLGILEMLSMTTYLLWSAVAAACVAVLVFFLPTLAWEIQILAFAVMTVISCVMWASFNFKYPTKSEEVHLNQRANQYIGRELTLDHPLINGLGRVFIDSLLWRIRCDDDLPAGATVIVVGVDGLFLKVIEKKDIKNKG